MVQALLWTVFFWFLQQHTDTLINWWQIWDTLVANTTYIGGKYKVWGEKEQGECQVVRPGNQRQNQRSTPISSDAQALCHSQLWKTTPGTMPLWKTMHCSWQLGTLHCRWAYYCDPISKAWCTQSVRGISLYLYTQCYLLPGQFTLPVPLELYLGVTEMWQKRSAECVSEAVTQGGPRRSLSATGPASVLSLYLYDDHDNY